MRATDFVESYFDAWNHRDPQAVADHLAANGVYCDVPEHARLSHDQLVAHLREFFAGNRLEYRLIGDILTGRDSIAFEYEIVPAGSRSGTPLRGAEFITLHSDAEALRIVDYYDVPAKGAARTRPSLTSRALADRKYAKSGLTPEQLARYGRRLDRIMSTERLYLRPDLTLPALARAVDCSVNHLSQVINSGFGMSFFDYLNQFRIAYARELLADPDGGRLPILNVAYTAGFNSNSAFYAAFKKCVGLTPAEYRRRKLDGTANS